MHEESITTFVLKYQICYALSWKLGRECIHLHASVCAFIHEGAYKD